MKAEVDISFEQLLGLVHKLDESQKSQLAEELKKPSAYKKLDDLKKTVKSKKLDQVLSSFRGVPITEEEINQTCEEVREELFNERSAKGHY